MQEKQQLKTFPGLKCTAFQHPWDVKATEALKAVPGFDFLCRKGSPPIETGGYDTVLDGGAVTVPG